MELLLRTVHGSRLYGLSHSGSDWDWFEIYGWDKFKGKQKIKDGDDRTRQSYDRFMRYCEKGVPQYLEAMFSGMAEVDNMPFNRLEYGVNYVNIRDTYLRTVKSFWMAGEEENSFKKKRHSARLALNLTTMYETGRFNPTLTPEQAEQVTAMAHGTEMPEVF
jgi:hypothetical protein